MTYDLKITGGMVVDGTGAAPFAANVAVTDGRIVEIGACAAEATRVIDAHGAIVTPGFIDLHCHYDGQVSWDADLLPSSVHGVTTAILGNCGVGFAPVREADRVRLIELMEGVEDIPGSALAEGIDFAWESFPEYMDAIDSRPHAIDIGLQVPHDALRVFVMGDRAVANEAATDEDIARMRELVREAVVAGAIGFSTGRTDNHRSKRGEFTPASEATARELIGIAHAFDGLSHGVLQAVSDFDMEHGPDGFDAEFDVFEQMASAAPERPFSMSLLQRDLDPTQWKRILARVEAANDKGMTMRVQAAPRGIGVMLGLEATFHPFVGFPSYKAISSRSLEERVAAMRDPAFKARLLSETSEKIAGDGSNIPAVADRMLAQIDMIALRMFRLGDPPDYEQPVEKSIYVEARNRGVSTLEAIYDAMLAKDGRELLYFPIFNYGSMSLDDVRTMIEHPLALVALSDGGAHVGTVCDASFPTFLLTHWARDRTEGRISIETAVRRLTSDVAQHLGLADRGVLAVGKRADLNVIDHANLRLHPPRLVHDLPAGGRRLLQDADGYLATIVGGAIIAEGGRLTGERPGRVVRVLA